MKLLRASTFDQQSKIKNLRSFILTGKRGARASTYPHEKHRRKRENLLPFGSVGKAEFDSARFIGFGGGDEIEIGKRNLLRALPGKIPQRLPDNRVILHFLFALIVEHEHGGRYNFRRGSLSAVRLSGRNMRINILISLLPHLLFLQIILIHLIGESPVAFIILIV